MTIKWFGTITEAQCTIVAAKLSMTHAFKRRRGNPRKTEPNIEIDEELIK